MKFVFLLCINNRWIEIVNVQKLSPILESGSWEWKRPQGHLNPIPWRSWFDGRDCARAIVIVYGAPPMTCCRVRCGKCLTEVRPSHGGTPPPGPRPLEPGTPGSPARPQGAVCSRRQAGPSELHSEPELSTGVSLVPGALWNGASPLFGSTAHRVFENSLPVPSCFLHS